MPKNQGSTLILLILVVFAVVFLFLMFWFFLRPNAEPKSSTQAVWQPGSELIRQGEIETPKKILEITINYDKSASQSAKISSVRLLNGFVPKYPQADGGYKLFVLDRNDKIVSKLDFSIPNQPVIWELPTGKKAPTANATRQANQPQTKLTFTLNMEYPDSNAQTLQINDPENQKIETFSIIDLKETNNKTSFYTFAPKKLTRNGSDPLFGVLAASSVSRLSIVFISDKYSNMEKFRDDINRATEEILSFEPFKTRSSQVLFSRVENSGDLDCNNPYPEIETFIICDDSLVVKGVNNAAAPFDKIVVLHDENRSAATAPLEGISGVVSTGPSFADATVHELGHLIGGLLDEYESPVSVPGPANDIMKNCYTGTPTEALDSGYWEGIPFSDYAPVCTKSSWYSSSADSIMRTLEAPYFNTVSERILNEKLDFFAGPLTSLPSAEPSPTLTSNPSSSASFAPAASVQASPKPSPTELPPCPSPGTQSKALNVGWFIPSANCK